MSIDCYFSAQKQEKCALGRDYLLPGVITEEKNIILSVNEYKLPAWSRWIL